MQGTIEHLPKENLPGSILLDGVGRAFFQTSDVLAGTPQLGARVSVKTVRSTPKGRLALEVWVLPPPLGPLEEGNEDREEVWILFSTQGSQRLAHASPGRMLFRPEHQALHERVRYLINALLASRGYEIPRLMAFDAGYVHLVWNLEAKEFQITSRGDQERHELAAAVSAVLESQSFQGWKHVVAGT